MTDRPCIAIALWSLVGVVVLVTLAPKLPLLHAIPRIGAPKLEVSFEPVADYPHLQKDPTALWFQILVKHHHPYSEPNTLFNVRVVGSDTIYGCDWQGHPKTPWETAPLKPAGRDFMTHAIVPLHRGTFGAYFCARVPKPGIYECRLSLGSKDLYGNDTTYSAEIKTVQGAENA
jgi:hypothetical protein